MPRNIVPSTSATTVRCRQSRGVLHDKQVEKSQPTVAGEALLFGSSQGRRLNADDGSAHAQDDAVAQRGPEPYGDLAVFGIQHSRTHDRIYGTRSYHHHLLGLKNVG